MMKYRIVNLFAMFHNPYNEPGWQLWHGNDLIGIYYTRAEVRAARKDRWRNVSLHVSRSNSLMVR